MHPLAYQVSTTIEFKVLQMPFLSLLRGIIAKR